MITNSLRITLQDSLLRYYCKRLQIVRSKFHQKRGV